MVKQLSVECVDDSKLVTGPDVQRTRNLALSLIIQEKFNKTHSKKNKSQLRSDQLEYTGLFLFIVIKTTTRSKGRKVNYR